MKLAESDSALSEVCRAIEIRLARFENLSDLALPVALLSNFDSLPEAQTNASYLSTPAAYQRSERRIIVNGQQFLPLCLDMQQAALAHEIAHAVYHRNPIVLSDPEYGIPLTEEIVADLLVCKWGFFVELRQERFQSYGARYCQILELWPEEESFVREMTIWHQQRLSGIT